jgi:hypothetical protein
VNALVEMAELAFDRLVAGEQADFGLIEAMVQQVVDGRLEPLGIVEHGHGLGAGFGGAGFVRHGASARANRVVL